MMLRGARWSLALLVFLAWAAPARADEVDDYVADQLKQKRIPGLSLAVVKDGKVIKAKGFGLANVELQCPATEETVYEIGSITKQFTAEAAMMLVEEDKLGLDDPISKYLDDLPDAWKDVTVRQLLNHTSGIKSYTSVGDFLQMARTDYKPGEILKLVRDRPADFAPGEKWLYNNTGYYLLGLIVEKAAGQRYFDFLRERIFQPLEMTKTRPSDPKVIIPGRSAGYGELLGVRFNRDPITPTAAFSAGALVSTVGDLAKWDAALREGKLLRSSSYESMYAPTKLKDGSTHPYGFGWGLESTRGHKALAHGGGTAGFSTMILRYVDDGLTVIVLTNLGGTDAGGIAKGVARRYLSGLSIRDAKPIDDPDPKLTERLKGVLEQVLAGKLDEDEFSPEFAKFLASDAARKMTKSLADEGEMKSFALIERSDEGKGTRLVYRAELGGKPYQFTFHLSDEGKITGLLAQRDD